MDDNNKPEQEMDAILEDSSVDDGQDTSAVDDSQDSSEDVVADKPEDTGSQRLNKRVEKNPDTNLDRILDRMRHQDRDMPRQPQEGNNFKPLDYQNGEFTVEQLEQDREAYAELRARTGFDSAVRTARTERQIERFVDNLEYDLERVSDKHPELNPDSDEFNPTRASRLNRMYYNFIGYDPDKGNIPQRTDVRYRDFIDGIMGLASDLSASDTVTATKNIARQASRTGVRPNATSNRGPSLDNPEDIASMTKEEYAKYRDKIMEKSLNMLETMQ